MERRTPRRWGARRDETNCGSLPWQVVVDAEDEDRQHLHPLPGALDDLADTRTHGRNRYGSPPRWRVPCGWKLTGLRVPGVPKRCAPGVLIERALGGIAQYRREHRHPTHHEVDRDAGRIVVEERRTDREENATGQLGRLKDDVHDDEVVEERPVVCHHDHTIGTVEVRNLLQPVCANTARRRHPQHHHHERAIPEMRQQCESAVEDIGEAEGEPLRAGQWGQLLGSGSKHSPSPGVRWRRPPVVCLPASIACRTTLRLQDLALLLPISRGFAISWAGAFPPADASDHVALQSITVRA